MTILPEVTIDQCTGCGHEVRGTYHRWSCTKCGASSPYREPPEEWVNALDNGTAPKRDTPPCPHCVEIHCVCPVTSTRPQGRPEV